MTIPSYADAMLPLLTFVQDGKEHTLSEAVDHLANYFHLTEDERKEILPSGAQRKFDNKVAWAKSYLKQACLLEIPTRGRFKITERGREVLGSQPEKLDSDYLMQFKEFMAFKNQSGNDKTDDKGDVSRQRRLYEKEDESQTPQELLEEGYQRIKNELATELLNTVKGCSPSFFERLVVDLLIKMGYGGSRKDAGQAIGGSGDGGIDGIIKEDKLGLDVIYIQAKRWQGSVGSKEIRNFVGSLAGQKANKGIFITTSAFTRDALEYVESIPQKVILIDGKTLAQLMIDHDIGLSKITSYELKKIDADYFMEE